MPKDINIDFVLLWVDSSDSIWREQYLTYQKEEKLQSDEKFFRDWDNLHYIFRAFEQFTPWVRKIHFVTQGHLPHWLNTTHPKLHIVEHQEILDRSDLPTFNSNAIEANIHRIDGLSEHFVLFNDDLFITKPLIKERFFLDGLPRDLLVLNALSSSSGVGHFVLNNLEIINKYFDKRQAMKKNIAHYFHYKYGFDMLRNIVLLPWRRFTGFVDPHQPQPFLKSTFEKVWSLERRVLADTSASRFRACSDTNQYLFRYWQLIEGDFVPLSMCDAKFLTLTIEAIKDGTIKKLLSSDRYALLCLNDSDIIADKNSFLEAKKILSEALQSILPHKSSYEL